MTLRRLAPLVSVLVLAGAVVPSAHAARPNPTCPGCVQVVSKSKLVAVVRPTAGSIDLLAR